MGVCPGQISPPKPKRQPECRSVRVLGPCTAPIARIKGVYRFHMILKAPRARR